MKIRHRRGRILIRNVRKTKSRGPSPSQIDPSRTITLRRALSTHINKVFGRVRAELIRLVDDNDTMGLTRKPIAINYNPRQPRDSKGRWTDGLGSAVGGGASSVEVERGKDGSVSVRATGDVGHINVSISPGGQTAHLHNISVVEEKAGAGRQIFRKTVETLRAEGVRTIVADATRSDEESGYYALARWGFDAPLPPPMRKQAARAGVSAEYVSELMQTQQGRDWWKKNGKTIRMEFSVDEDSSSMRALTGNAALWDDVWNRLYIRDRIGRFASSPGGGPSIKGVLEIVKGAGAAVGHAEHAAKAWVTDKVGKTVAKLPPGMQKAVTASWAVAKVGTKVAFASWTAGQAFAEKVAKQRGYSDEQARKLRGVLSAADLATFKPLSIGLGFMGASAATLGLSSFIPPASIGYLAYSTARDPAATLRAAKEVVKDVAGGIRKRLVRNVEGNEEENAGRIADALERHDFDDWYHALLMAAMEEVQDIDGAIRIADEMWDETKPPGDLTANEGEWRFKTDQQKVEAFKEWLRRRFQLQVTSVEERTLWDEFIRRGFLQGGGRAFDDTKRSPELRQALEAESADVAPEFFEGSREAFLRTAFTQPVAVEKLKLLTSRVYSDLEGVSEEGATRLSRVLADHLAKGSSPREAARELANQLDMTRERALLIARTEIIRAHAEGQLTALEELGVDEVGVAVEWSTTGDGRVCSLCAPLKGTVLKISEARGMLPRHPNCRCAWVPANVGEDKRGQKRTASSVRAAVRDSKERGGDEWGTKIDEDRPVENLSLDGFSEFLAVNRRGGANCGIAAGGFQKGNTCGKKGSGSLKSTSGLADRSARESVRIEKGSPREMAEVKRKVAAKVASAPVPSRGSVIKARAELEKAKRGEGRAGGDSRGGSAKDRRKQRENLFREFEAKGPDGKGLGYVVCHMTGLKMHHTADPKENPKGYPVFERGKIFTKYQGGGYQIPNLIPESLSGNSSRNDIPVRSENLD